MSITPCKKCSFVILRYIGSGIAGWSYFIATFPIKYAISKTKRLEIAISHEMTKNFILNRIVIFIINLNLLLYNYNLKGQTGFKLVYVDYISILIDLKNNVLTGAIDFFLFRIRELSILLFVQILICIPAFRFFLVCMF